MAGWRVLTLSGSENGNERPVLLVRHVFLPNQYTVYLTDLAHIWEESLDRKSIIKRALNDGTSIDPSEGADQLKLLLNHIQRTIDGEAGSLQLSEAEGRETLNLDVSIDLPSPLEPLRWTIALRQKDNNVIFQQLQVPLFERSFSRQAEVDSLLSHITEKDGVISRLVDKLESSGIELASIFPGAGLARGPKASARDHLFRSIPGLRPFNEEQWRLKNDESRWKSRVQLLERTFASDGDVSISDGWTLPDSWWRSLKPTGELLSFPSHESSVRLSPPPLNRNDTSKTGEDDDFQSQDISKLSRHKMRSSKVQVKDSQPADKIQADSEGSTTEDEDDLDTPTSPAKEMTTQPVPTTSPPAVKRLGMLGGQRKIRPTSPPLVANSMEVDNDLSPAAASTSAIELAQPAQMPKRKLGTIGGRPAKPWEPDGSNNNDASDVYGRNVQDTDAERMPRSIVQSKKPPVRETSTERADRLRAELKQDLEEKRKAPTKKKRKF